MLSWLRERGSDGRDWVGKGGVGKVWWSGVSWSRVW